MEEKIGKEKTAELMTHEGVARLSQAEIKHDYDLYWPEAPDDMRLKAAIICYEYNLNPLMRHIALFSFKKYEYNPQTKQKEQVGLKWEVVQQIASNRIIARRRHHFTYLDLTPRRMTEAEEQKINGEIDKTRIWAITLLKDLDTGEECNGVGWYPLDEKVPVHGADKGNSRLNMAKIRSERNALDRQYPAELPQNIRVADEREIEGEFTLLNDPDGAEDGTGVARAEGDTSSPAAGGAGDKTSAAAVAGTGSPGGQAAPAGMEPAGGGAVARPGQESGQGGGEGSAPAAAEAKDTGRRVKKPERTGSAPDAEIRGEGFTIDAAWLDEIKKALKWNEYTWKSFLENRYKVDTHGTIPEILQRLTRKQADEFTKEMNNRKDKQPHLM